MKKNIQIKQKIINHLIKNGKKRTSEKILIKSIKTLQKQSIKQIKKILQLAITNSSPIFKLYIRKKKKKIKSKEMPIFISNKNQRTSAAIKFILKETRKKKTNIFYKSLKKQILDTSKKNSNIIEQKNNIQKQATLKKRFFRYYRWN